MTGWYSVRGNQSVGDSWLMYDNYRDHLLLVWVIIDSLQVEFYAL
jgi:hypothetical protein